MSATYSIKDLEKFSGVKAHTIRIWEQRYAIITPKRSASNIRFYTEDDLKFLMNIAFLNRKGIRISKIAKMERKKIEQQVNNQSTSSIDNDATLQAYAIAMLNLDEPKFRELTESLLKHRNLEYCLVNYWIPFLDKVGLLWISGSIHQLHQAFVMNLMQRYITTELHRFSNTNPLAPTILLYQPDANQHNLGMAIIEYLMRSKRFKTVYIGQSVQAKDLSIALKTCPASIIYTSLEGFGTQEVQQEYIHTLQKYYPNQKFIIHTTAPIKKLPPQCQIISDLAEFLDCQF